MFTLDDQFSLPGGTGSGEHPSAWPAEPLPFRPMQEVELALIGAGALALVVIWAIQGDHHLTRRPAFGGALLGIVPGILGAVVVLVPRTDLVPDPAEPYLWILVATVATGVVFAAVVRGVSRR